MNDMSELQAEETEVDFDEVEQIENDSDDTEQLETVSDSAPELEETPEKKVEFTEEQQKVFDDVISKKVFKAKEAERENARLRKELETLKAAQTKETRPEIPQLPESYEDDFEQKLKARDQAILDAAAFDMRERQRAEDQKQVNETKRKQELERLQAKVDGYSERAGKLGIKPDALAKAGKMVAEYGIHNDVAEYILENENGPLITAYLSKNLDELDKIQDMTPTKAAVYVETVIRRKLAAKKTTGAPEPVEPLKGQGIPLKKRGPPGATFT